MRVRRSEVPIVFLWLREWHLFHPRSLERNVNLPEYRAAQQLGQRYRLTRTPEAMRGLIAERWKEALTERQRVFSDIYRTNGWNGTGTRAGPGSSMRATAGLRAELPALVAKLGVTSVLDAGCSDSLWMPELPGYVGVDIVPDAVKVARKRHPNREYRVLDMCTDELPEMDLVICRDALQHMSFEDAKAALANFALSRARWLMVSTHRGGHNEDIATGGYHEIDMQAAPFDLPEPVWSVPDGTWDNRNRFPHKVFGLWPI